MRKPEKLERLEELVFTWSVGILGGVAGGIYTGMIASPENPQDMRYILGGLVFGSLVGYCMDYITRR